MSIANVEFVADDDHGRGRDNAETRRQLLAQFEQAWTSRLDNRSKSFALATEANQLAKAVDLSEPDKTFFYACYLLISANRDMQEGNLAEGLPKLLEANAILQETSEFEWLSRTLNLLGNYYIQLGNRTLAAEYWLANANLVETHGTPLDVARAHHNLGWIPYQAGDYERAIPYFERSLPEIRKSGNYHHLALNLCNLATCLTHEGDIEQAVAYLNEALLICKQKALPVEENIALQRLGLLAEKRQDWDTAVAYYQEALSITQQVPDPFSRIPNLHAISRVYLEQGRIGEAKKYLEEALRQSQYADRKQYLYDTHELLGRLYQADGDLEKALIHFHQFHAIKEEVFNESNEQTVQNLRIMHQTDTVRREAALLKSQNELLEREVTRRTQELEQLLAEREEMTKKLVQVLAREEELSELKSHIITTVSHEFRTPLTVISTSADLIKRYMPTAVNEKQERHFKRIAESVLYINDLLSDIALVHTATAEEKIPVRKIKLAFNQLWEPLQRQLRENVGYPPNLIFEYDAEDAQPMTLDITLLKSVLTNLLTNALKYSPPDQPIVMRGTCTEEQLVIKVIDQGVGIPANEQEKIFDLFYRASNTDHKRGLGLGLFITRELTGLMGGTIKAESPGPGQGSQFVVRLPIADEA